MKNIAIVVLNWNRKEETLECIKSLEKLIVIGFKVEVVIVDNASTDNSLYEFKKIKSVNKFKVKIIENSSNLGFAAGNNVGIRYAINHKYDGILLLNNDTRVDKYLLSNFVKVSADHKNFGMLSPKIYFEKGYEFHKNRYTKNQLGHVIWSAGGNIDWNNVYGTNRGVDEVDSGQYENEEEIVFATGACVFINTNALKKTGFFDERYFMYFEDVDLAVRMKKARYKIYYVPSAVIWHKVAQSSGIGSSLNDYFIARNRMLFATLYSSFRTRFAVLREAMKLIIIGRRWQRQGVIDFLTGKFGKGSFIS